MVPERRQRKYGAQKVKIADITVQQMLFEKLRKLRRNFFFRKKKAQTKITRNEHNESSEIFDRHFL